MAKVDPDGTGMTLGNLRSTLTTLNTEKAKSQLEVAAGAGGREARRRRARAHAAHAHATAEGASVRNADTVCVWASSRSASSTQSSRKRGSPAARRSPRLRMFDGFDVNKDGKLSFDEQREYTLSLKSPRAGRCEMRKRGVAIWDTRIGRGRDPRPSAGRVAHGDRRRPGDRVPPQPRVHGSRRHRRLAAQACAWACARTTILSQARQCLRLRRRRRHRRRRGSRRTRAGRVRAALVVRRQGSSFASASRPSFAAATPRRAARGASLGRSALGVVDATTTSPAARSTRVSWSGCGGGASRQALHKLRCARDGVAAARSPCG